eukprot:gnl/Hemi2/22045_TR7348_c0_g1_i3.p1 gnl/Hemi2/22045_TR7348_c0_g1~~gnl/Hemi2/22045_TR7348_c0_g1_i3.p1  ORF type:complete len:235 (-),score=21.64 gnl/Hemi2/22045_TR7348_c0_g1_i3:85-789(-)
MLPRLCGHVWTDCTPYTVFRGGFGGSPRSGGTPFPHYGLRTPFTTPHQRFDLHIATRDSPVSRFDSAVAFQGASVWGSNNITRKHLWKLEAGAPLPSSLGVVWLPIESLCPDTPADKAVVIKLRPRELVKVDWDLVCSHSVIVPAPDTNMHFNDYMQALRSLPWEFVGDGTLKPPQHAHGATYPAGVITVGLVNWMKAHENLQDGSEQEQCIQEDDEDEVMYVSALLKMGQLSF